MPPWPLRGQSEFEGCFATYYDFTEQVPDGVQGPDRRVVPLERLRGPAGSAEPSPAALLLPAQPAPGGVDVHDPSFGTWTCAGGVQRRRGLRADGSRLLRRGRVRQRAEALVCLRRFRAADRTGRPRSPAARRRLRPTSCSPAGVYQQLPLKGVMYWNTHAFNTTAKDHIMNGRVNYYFATPSSSRPGLPNQRLLGHLQSEQSTVHQGNVLQRSRLPGRARVFQIFGHNHKHGEHFWATDPTGADLR